MTGDFGQRKEGDELDSFLAERADMHPDLTEVQMQAAYALGFGDEIESVVAALNINRNNLAQWRAYLPFAEFEAQVSGTSRRFKQVDYTTSTAQVVTLNDLAKRHLDLIDSRAKENRGETNGAQTGLLVCKVIVRKTAAKNNAETGEKEYTIFEEWSYDHKAVDGLLETFERIEKLLGWNADEGKMGKVVDRPTVMGIIQAKDADRVINDNSP